MKWEKKSRRRGTIFSDVKSNRGFSRMNTDRGKKRSSYSRAPGGAAQALTQAVPGGTSVRFSTVSRLRGGSSTMTGIKTMHDRDDQTGSAVGDQRCAQTRSHGPLTTDNAQPTTGRKSLRFIYEHVKPLEPIIRGDLLAKSLILNMTQMGRVETGQLPVGMTKTERKRCEERTASREKRVLSFERIARGGQPVHPPPDQAVDGDHHDGHDNRRSQQQIEIAGVAGTRDGSAQTNGGVRLVLQPEILSDDAGVPRAARSGDKTSDEIGEDSGQNQSAPALKAFELEQVRRFSQIGGNRHGARDYVEQDVPLRSQQQKQNGTEPQTAANSNEHQQHDGKQRRRRDRSRNLRQRLCNARQLGIESDGDTYRNCPRRADGKCRHYAEKRRAGADQHCAVLRGVQTGEHNDGARDRVQHRDHGNRAAGPDLPGSRWRVFVGGVMEAREMKREPLAQGSERFLAQPSQSPRPFDDAEKPGARRVGALHLLHLEFFCPRNYWPPHNLVEQHDDRDHGSNAPQDRLRVARAGRGLQIRAESWQTKVAVAQYEHLARHKEKPAACDRHHGVPHESNCSVRQLELREPLIPVEAVDLGGLAHVARNALQRRVEAEGHVPDLPGENEQDCAHFHADLVMREKRHHREHHARQKAEDRNRLQNVEQRNHDALGLRVIGSNVAVNQREGEREHVRDSDPQQRVSRVHGKFGGIARDLDVRIERAKPCASENEHGVEERKTGSKDDEVGQHRPGLRGQQRPRSLAENANRLPAWTCHQASPRIDTSASASSRWNKRPVSES